jgi:predicted enzyme related to lactoylglutathione lyase
MTHVSGPDFLSVQVRDLQRSAGFYQRELGLQPMAGSPPGVVAFQTSPIPFAVREPLPGTDLDAGPAGLGVLLSLRADDAQALHDQLKTHGVPILTEPFDTPFGRTFVFQDPDGYAIAAFAIAANTTLSASTSGLPHPNASSAAVVARGRDHPLRGGSAGVPAKRIPAVRRFGDRGINRRRAAASGTRRCGAL